MTIKYTGIADAWNLVSRLRSWPTLDIEAVEKNKHVPTMNDTPALPSPVDHKTLKYLIPQECFHSNDLQAVARMAFSFGMIALGSVLVMIVPWMLSPVAWLISGVGFAGCWVLAHDCGHGTLFRRKKLNTLLGHVLLLPTLYPYESLKQSHSFHHQFLNHIEKDSVWRPDTFEAYAGKPLIYRLLYRVVRGPGWWLGAAFHIAKSHYGFTHEGKRQTRTRRRALSILISVASVAGLSIWAVLDTEAFVSFFLLPWFCFSAILSLISGLQHTSPGDSQAVSLQWRDGDCNRFCIERHTVDLQLPTWVEYLIHGVNIHVLHHHFPKIPCYRLGRAREAVISSLGYIPWKTIPVNLKTIMAFQSKFIFFHPPSKRLISFQQAKIRGQIDGGREKLA